MFWSFVVLPSPAAWILSLDAYSLCPPPFLPIKQTHAQRSAVEEEAPPLKKAKIDGEETAQDATKDAGAAAVAAAAASKPPTSTAPLPPAPVDAPVKIGYKTFESGSSAAKYFYTLINSVTQGQELNEYEFHNVIELLRAGHPEAERKLRGSGVAPSSSAAAAAPPSVRAVVVRPHAVEGSPCFHLVRTDGSVEDFSTKKCVCALFPAYAAQQAAKPPRPTSNDNRGGGNKHGGGGGGSRHGGGSGAGGQRSGGRGGGGNSRGRGGGGRGRGGRGRS